MMSSNDNKDNAEKGYSSMLKAIESLVTMEGKNIREAILMAEDKLSEWGELGREEVSTISDEVTRDLGSLGETVEKAKSSFKEKWEIDKKYLSDSTWDILSNVADKTTLALIDFGNDIQSRADQAKRDLHEREHKDHREWHSDHEMWLDDISRWENFYKLASKRIQTLQDDIQIHSERLKQHAAAIRTHDYIDSVHEKEIARSEEHPDNAILDKISSNNEKSYEAMIEKHKKEALVHQELKEAHRQTVLLISELYKKSTKLP